METDFCMLHVTQVVPPPTALALALCHPPAARGSSWAAWQQFGAAQQVTKSSFFILPLASPATRFGVTKGRQTFEEE